ncbi:MAG: hypothetical protein NC548_42295 [Lachnospiraceae bacterium]|nr:hypothetical protein [Lachnospiraceae bacterium]
MKTKGKQMLYGVSTFAMCFMLTGCGHTHTWAEATCTTPKTCNECGETEGEALGHTWAEATCATPKTCTVCGETEGEPLAHTWVEATCAEAKHCNVCGETEGEPLAHTLIEANYQQAATCEVCGETVGEPLQADFEKFGIECNAEQNTEYPFVIPCYNPAEYTTAGKIIFSDYEVFESDDTHEALEGYEWRAITTTTIFDDENAYNYGYSGFSPYSNDYYNTTDDTYNEDTDTYTLNYNGIDYSDVKDDSEVLQGGWNGDIFTYQVRLFFRVPIGYDGKVVTVIRYDSSTWDDAAPITDKISDDTVFFRLK